MRMVPLLTLMLVLLSPAGLLRGADVRGVVVRVDPEKNEVHLDQRGLGRRGRPLTVVLTPNTQFQVGRSPGRLSDVVVGKRLRIDLEEKDGKLFARSIQVVQILPLTPPTPPDAGHTPPPATREGVTGELRRVGYTDREVVVIGPGNKGPQTETILKVPDDVKVFQDGKPLPFEELPYGVLATIQTGQEKGKATARVIQVGKQVPEAAMPSSATPTSARGARLLRLAERALETLKLLDLLPREEN